MANMLAARTSLDKPDLGAPGNRVDGDDLAPNFRLDVNGITVSQDISQYIESVEYESAIGMADMLRINITNPGLVDPDWPDWNTHKVFQPSYQNEAQLSVGYGQLGHKWNFVGRVCWQKHLPRFPREGMPVLEVKGYDASVKMSHATSPIKSSRLKSKAIVSQPVGGADNLGQVFSQARHSDVVVAIAEQHAFHLDIDHTDRHEDVILKKNQNHWEIVKGLANLNDRDAWVDYDTQRNVWVLHWKAVQHDQKPMYVFRYGVNGTGTLLDAMPEYGLHENVTAATILIWDGKAQQWVSVRESHSIGDEDSAESPFFTRGGGLLAKASATENPPSVRRNSNRPRRESPSHVLKRKAKDAMVHAFENAARWRIAAGGFAIDVTVPPNRRFNDLDEASAFLWQWFKKRQDNFITVQGSVIGTETLRARQTHTLLGLGDQLDGEYFFTRVRHMVAPAPYTCEFTANKVMRF